MTTGNKNPNLDGKKNARRNVVVWQEGRKSPAGPRPEALAVKKLQAHEPRTVLPGVDRAVAVTSCTGGQDLDGPPDSRPYPLQAVNVTMLLRNKLEISQRDTPTFSLAVHGTPKPQPRPRFVNGRVISIVSDPVNRWKTLVRRQIRLAQTALGWDTILFPKRWHQSGLRVFMEFWMPTKTKSRWGMPHQVRPDGDNLAKLVMDCLTVDRVYEDDSMVSDLRVRKFWVPESHAGLTILIEPYRTRPVPLPDAVPAAGESNTITQSTSTHVPAFLRAETVPPWLDPDAAGTTTDSRRRYQDKLRKGKV